MGDRDVREVMVWTGKFPQELMCWRHDPQGSQVQRWGSEVIMRAMALSVD